MTEIQSSFDIRVPAERALLFAQLYEETFPQVAKFVATHGGTFDDAKDIFQDALVILYEKSSPENALVVALPERYLIGIAKHLWIRKFNADHKKIGLDEMEKTITVPEDYYEHGESRLTTLLELTGRKCLQLLRAFYYDGHSIEQVKAAFGFSSAHSASSQKFKCIGKMRNIIQEKSMGYEDFA
jgi:DNA-directed RNA polymerase specialized sigma24 family protein